MTGLLVNERLWGVEGIYGFPSNLVAPVPRTLISKLSTASVCVSSYKIGICTHALPTLIDNNERGFLRPVNRFFC